MNRKTKIVKLALKEALLDLLEEKPIVSISVRNLCQLADVHRSTFYAHYENLNALVAEMEEDFLSHVAFFDGCQPAEGDLTAIEEFVRYVKENQRLFLLLMENGRLCASFFSYSAKLNHQNVNLHHHAMLTSYALYGTINALIYWLKNPGSRTEREVAQLLYRCSCVIAKEQF